MDCAIYVAKKKSAVVLKYKSEMSRVMIKLAFCICKNKDADQLRSNCAAAHQRLCFHYIDSTTPLLCKLEMSRL